MYNASTMRQDVWNLWKLCGYEYVTDVHDILSDINSDIICGILFGILPGIFSDKYPDSQSVL
jgi:hypothetical protein